MPFVLCLPQIWQNLVNLEDVALTLPPKTLGSLVTKKLPSCSSDE